MHLTLLGRWMFQFVASKARGMIKPLTSLRFFAAMAVVAHHYISFGPGYSGVTFFYVLSGYVLALNYSGRVSTPAQIRDFYWRRFARIYPTHLLTLLIAVPLGGTLLAFIANLLLLQSWVPLTSYYLGYNSPSWSISNEMAFYAVFPLLVGVATRRNAIIWVIGLVAVAALFAFAYPSPLGSNPGAHFLFYVFPPTRAFEFFLGIVMAKVPAERRFGLAAEAGAGLFALASMGLYYLHLPGSFSASLIYLPSAWLLIFVFSRSDGALGRLLSSPLLVLLGDASFALYMLHNLLPRYVSLPMSVMAVLAVALSVAWHLAIERPAQRFLLRRYRFQHREVQHQGLGQRSG
jgi:peptidoglycan/LPS O-acetylase OafA/YrhL